MLVIFPFFQPPIKWSGIHHVVTHANINADVTSASVLTAKIVTSWFNEYVFLVSILRFSLDDDI